MLVPVKDSDTFSESLELDIKFYNNHTKKYEELQEYYHNEKDRIYDEFMGEEFKTEPLSTKEEKEEEIKTRQSRILTIQNLKGPKSVLEYEMEVLSKLMDEYVNAKYIVTEPERIYREQYEIKDEEFYDCPEWQEFLEEFNSKVISTLKELGEV